MSLMFTGIGVSRGIATGEAHLLRRNQIDVTSRTLTRKAVPAEVRRLKRALKAARAQMLTARDNIPKDAPSDVSSFIETHLLMLDDSLLSQRPIEVIKAEQINAEAALQQQREALAKVFGSMEDVYLATRVDDVNHVIDAIMRALDVDEDQPIGGEHWKGQIIIADDLTPADTVTMRHHGVAGFVTETGGPLSHTAILARSLGIPAIVGVPQVRRYITNGETLTLDGQNGLVLAEATDEMLADFRKQQKEFRQQRKELAKLIDTESVTADGTAFGLFANIEFDDDLKALRAVNADGVGLYRTEFLYLDSDTLPTEQDHFRIYSKVIRALKGAPVTFRTADLGADKMLDSAAADAGPLAHNPAMGLRGLRVCLNDHSLFIPQLRALLRASAKGPVRILLPMITNLAEVHQSLALIAMVKENLQAEGIEFDPDVQVGGMIEVPAAAITAASFAAELDFLSIGTNDLIQYTLAIDRIDDQVNYLYDPLHPAVLELIRMTIDAGNRAGIPVSMCGEMAGDLRFVRLLLGLGLTEFSMPPNFLLEVKRSLIDCSRAKLKKQAVRLLKAATAEEQLTLLDKMNDA